MDLPLDAQNNQKKDKHNLLKSWRFFMKNIKSPDSFIDMGFYYMIAAALQRRVWCGPTKMPIFPNPYYILVGKPGVGKGLVIKPINDLMRYHKLNARAENKIDYTKLSPEQLKLLEEAQTLLADNKKKSKSGLEDEKLLFHIPADATTYEALMRANTKAIRRINPTFKCDLVPPSGIYTHQSMCFVLEELSSLFRKHTHDLMNYLLSAWDCRDYEYDTKHQGRDKIRNTCLSILAGTTPGFMRDTFSDKLIDEGLAARTVYIFANENRFNRFGILEFTDEQLKENERIRDHLKKLSTLFGQITYTEEAQSFYKNYFEKVLPYERANQSLKLDAYYSKKDVQVQKLAIAIHFSYEEHGDGSNMVIDIETAKMALNILNALELNMHYALQFSNKNPLSNVGQKAKALISFRREAGITFREIWLELEGDARVEELNEVMDYLIQTGQIELNGTDNKYRIKGI